MIRCVFISMCLASSLWAGDLFVTTSSSHQVQQFNDEDGDPLGNFCTVANPAGLAFRPLQTLFVAPAGPVASGQWVGLAPG